MKRSLLKAISWVAFLAIFLGSCKKNSEDEMTKSSFEKKWIHQNGGSYKSENLYLKLEDESLQKASLNWSRVNRFSIGKVNYTEIPFSFKESNNQDVSFSFMIRTIDSVTEGAIKYMQKNLQLKGKKGDRNGTIETFNRLDGTWINTWFSDAVTGTVVQQGQQIGLSGRTGNAQHGFSPHIHFQVVLNGTKVNPEDYIATKFNGAGVSTGNPCQ